jgi:hypothetical protein
MQTEENEGASRDVTKPTEQIESLNSAESTGPSVEIEVSASYPLEVKRDLAGGEEDPSRTHGYKLSWRPTEMHIFVSADGVKMCHVGLVRQTVEVSGAPLEVAGAGGVLVRSG